MPKFNRNNKTTDLSALLSNSVIVTQWHGKTVISGKPHPAKRKHNSPKQEDSIDRFRDAHHYAKSILKSNEMMALYTKGINAQKTSAHTVAFQDYLTSPVIHYIRTYNFKGKAGDVITVKATDDFRVEAVEIKIIDGKGKLVEKGKAERYHRKPFIWKYKTTVANKNFKSSTLEATATDLPGNKTVLKVMVEDIPAAHMKSSSSQQYGIAKSQTPKAKG